MQTSVKTPRSSSSTSRGWTCPHRRSIKREEESQEKLWHDETEIHIKPSWCPEPVLLYNAAVQCCTIQYTLQYSTVQYGTHFSTVLYNAVHSIVHYCLFSLQIVRCICPFIPGRGGIVSVYTDTELISIHNRKPSPKNAREYPGISPGLSAFWWQYIISYHI